MPLSEHEQRVLHEMEQALYRHDPRFANRVRDESVYRYAGRNLRWSILGFLAGLAIMVAFFTVSPVAGFAGVALMFVSLVGVAVNLKRMGRAGLDDLNRTVHAGGVGHTLGQAGSRIRKRFRSGS
ncbi:MAG: DUF3040 domain-containing protein [Actinomycetota bacterium]|nr:DUF3040 domain-containing protein [Actinomycetota bacterium]